MNEEMAPLPKVPRGEQPVPVPGEAGSWPWLTSAGTPGRPPGWGSPGDRSGYPREPHCSAADPALDGDPVCQPREENTRVVLLPCLGIDGERSGGSPLQTQQGKVPRF